MYPAQYPFSHHQGGKHHRQACQRQRQVQQPGRRLAGRAVHRDMLMVWEDNIDLGEGIIPIHLLNPICAVHLRQEHGFKRWQTRRFKETFPSLIREDDAFAFAALHYLVHVEQGVVPLGESGTVALVRLIKPPGTDHLHP